MGHRSVKDALLVFAHYALLVWMAHPASLLLGGFVRAIVLAAFVLLLFFAIGRSANFLKTVAICFYALPSAFLSASITAQWVRLSPDALIPPDEPLRASLFQRPPPLYSL